MTLEEQIKEATPLGGIYQHDCPGGWTAYAGKNARGGFICQYIKAIASSWEHDLAKKQVQSFADMKESGL